MKKTIRNGLSLLLAAVLLLGILPAGVFFAQATEAIHGEPAVGGSFKAHFTDVKITTDQGDPLPEPLPWDTAVRVELAYTIPADGSILINTAYTFDLPTQVTHGLAQPERISIFNTESGEVAGTVTVEPSGDCSIVFTDAEVVEPGTGGSFYLQTTIVPGVPPVENGWTFLRFDLGPSSPVNIPISFSLNQIKGSVGLLHEGNLPTGSETIDWTVEVTPALENILDTDGVLLTVGADEIQDFTVSVAVDAGSKLLFDPDDAATYPTLVGADTLPVSGATFAHTDADANGKGGTLTCTLPDGTWSAGDAYTLTYKTAYDLSSFGTQDGKLTLKNKATAQFSHRQYTADSYAGNVTLAAETKTVTQTDVVGSATISAYVFKKEKAAYDSKLHTITWKLTINESAFPFETFSVTDSLPKGLKVTKVEDVTHTATELVRDTDYTYTPDPNNDYAASTLTLLDLSGGQKYVIQYTTEIDPAVWMKNEVKFTNNASFTGVIDGVGFPFGRKASINEANGLLSATGAYNRTNHTITWTIGVNKDTTAITNGEITIAIPAGLTVSELTAPDGWTVDNSDAAKPKVSLPSSNPTAKGDIVVKTTVDEANYWATNRKTGAANPDDKQFVLGPVHFHDDNGIDLNVSPAAFTRSTVVAKSSPADGYDYQSKEITWTVKYNQNKMAMTNPVLTDTLQAGTALVYEPGKVEEALTAKNGAVIEAATYDPETRVLTVTLGSMTAGTKPDDVNAPSITYKTKITDNSLLKWTGPGTTSAVFTNTCTIAFDEAPTVLAADSSLSATASRQVGLRPLVKKGNTNDDYRLITWEVWINPNRTDIPAPRVADEIPAKLVLDPDSVKLYRASVSSTDGSLSTNGDPVYDGSRAENPGYEATLVGRNFTFAFENDIHEAYILTFDTDNLDPQNSTYTNTVIFADETTGDNSGGSTNVIQKAAGQGSTNPQRRTIELTALDARDSSAIANVQYTITGQKTGITTTVTTNAAGKALFTPLRVDTYVVTESLAHNAVKDYKPLQPTPTFVFTYGDADGEKTQKKDLYYTKATENVTLDYEPNYAEGATGTSGDKPDQLVKPKNYMAVLLDTPFVWQEHVFDGWTRNQDGSGPLLKPGDLLKLEQNTVLYAQWHKAAGKITVTARSDEPTPVYFQDRTFTLTPEQEGALPMERATDTGGKIVFDVDLGGYALTQPFPAFFTYEVGGASRVYVYQTTQGPTDYAVTRDRDAFETEVIYTPGVLLTYDGNGNTDQKPPVVEPYKPNDVVTIKGNTFFEKSNHYFTAWNTKPDGTGTVYRGADLLTITEDTTLYAQWQMYSSGGSKPEVKPDPVPEVKPDPAPEVKPDPDPAQPTPPTETVPPTVQDKIDEIVKEVTRDPGVVIRSPEQFQELYPDLNIEDLPIPLYWGPDYAIVERPNGDLIAIDSELVPLGYLPLTGVDAASRGLLATALLALGLSATAGVFTLTRLRRRRHRG